MKPRSHGWYKNFWRSGCLIKVTTTKDKFRWQEFVYVELSLPKLLNGSNVLMLERSDLDYINDSLTSILAEEVPSLQLEVAEAEISRLDLPYNWTTGSEAQAHAYRDAMKEVHIGRHLRRWICADMHGTDTVYWSNHQQEICFYPKFPEMLALYLKTLAKVSKGNMDRESLEMYRLFMEMSVGMIRLEHRWLVQEKVEAELERFGYQNRADIVIPHLLDITKVVIEEDMKSLGLDQGIEIADERSRLELLEDACEGDILLVERLSGFLWMCDQRGVNNLRSSYSGKTFDKRIKLLKELQIPIAKPRPQYLLPPLSAPTFEERDAGLNKTNISSPERLVPTVVDQVMNVEGIF